MDPWSFVVFISLVICGVAMVFLAGYYGRSWNNYELGRLIGAQRIQEGKLFQKRMHLKAILRCLIPISGFVFWAGWLAAGRKDYEFGLHVGEGDRRTAEILKLNPLT